MSFICLFLPPLLILYILKIKIFNNQDYKIQDFIFYYAISNILINFSILLISIIITDNYSYAFTISFSFKYLLLSIFLAILYSTIYIKKDVIFSQETYKMIVKKFKTWVISHKIILLYILLFIVISILFIGLDIYLRKLSFALTKFYSIKNITPFLFTFAYLFLFYFILIIFSKKGRIIFTSIMYILYFLLFIVQYMMLKIKEEAFSIYDIKNASEGFEFLNFLIKEIKFPFIATALGFILIFVLTIIIIKKIEIKENRNLKKKFIILLIGIISFISFRFLAIANYEDYSHVLWDRVLYPRYYYENFLNSKKSLSVCGYFEYTYRDFYLFIKELKNNPSSIEDVNNYLNNKKIEYEKNDYTGIFKGKNLIMIMLESVDNIMATEENMPTITQMKNNSFVFPKRYSQLSSGGSTIATEFTSMTGLFYNGKNYNLNKNTYNESIPSILSNNNYYTNSIHENRGVYYNRIESHKSYGFENSYFVLDNKKDFKRYNDELLISDDDIYNKIINKGDKKNFMSFIITMSAHGPYKNNYACSADAEAMETEYNCVKYLAGKTDNFLKLLLERLKEDKLLDDTVIVMYADHYAYAYSYQEEEKNFDVIDDNHIIQNLPLIIYQNNLKPQIFDDILIDDIDILPTILNLLGIKYNPNKYLGEDAFYKNRHNVAIFTDYSWYDGNIYSFNANVDISTKDYEDNSQYASDILNFNQMIIDTNYYKT